MTAPVVAWAPADVVTLAKQTSNQSWVDGTRYAFALPAGTFADSAGSRMTYSAFQTGGTVNATTFMTFNAASGTLSGTAPLGMNGTAVVEIVATNAAGSKAVDDFSISFSKTAAAAQLLAASSLQKKVGSMVNAMAAFSNEAAISAPALALTDTQPTASGALARLLAQYDANGHPQLQAVAASTPPANLLTALQNHNQAILASGK